MPYHKNKQQAFQAAEQGHKQTLDAYAYSQLVKEEADYGKQLKHVKEEVNETYAQIENAMEVASDTQRRQLEQYKQDLQSIVNELNLD